MKIEASKAKTKLPRIMRAAIRLFVEKGVDATTTKDISRAAGVSEGAFYRHYPSKDALALAIYQDNLEEICGLLHMAIRPEGSLNENLAGLIGVLFEKYEEDPLLARYVLFAQFREGAKLPKKFQWPSDAVRRALEYAAEKKEVARAEIPHLTPMIFGAIVRCIVFRTYDDLPDLRTLVKKTARRCAMMCGVKA